mmetsp:Transcript_576/g.2290  ORF Transcript_576/g.2290 Transcript_576/m.2290 type:complete len:283 (-) Transcript_576:1725-2573(-)
MSKNRRFPEKVKIHTYFVLKNLLRIICLCVYARAYVYLRPQWTTPTPPSLPVCWLLSTSLEPELIHSARCKNLKPTRSGRASDSSGGSRGQLESPSSTSATLAMAAACMIDPQCTTTTPPLYTGNAPSSVHLTNARKVRCALGVSPRMSTVPFLAGGEPPRGDPGANVGEDGEPQYPVASPFLDGMAMLGDLAGGSREIECLSSPRWSVSPGPPATASVPVCPATSFPTATCDLWMLLTVTGTKPPSSFGPRSSLPPTLILPLSTVPKRTRPTEGTSKVLCT